MDEEIRLDELKIDGLNETYAQNMDAEEVVSPAVMLVNFLIDGSSSMRDYDGTGVMHECLESYKEAIAGSKQADEMMVAKTVFNSTISPGGYVLPEDMNTDYHAEGRTRLYDAIIDARQRLLSYMEELLNNGTNPRACIVILSDGEDYGSDQSLSDARKAVLSLIKKEITVAFIAFGQEALGIADDLGINKSNVLEVSNDVSALRRAIEIVSKSAISASKKASSGVASGNSGFFDV